MLVLDGRQRDQRHLPRMALIQPSFTSTGLQIEAPDMKPLQIHLSTLPNEIVMLE